VTKADLKGSGLRLWFDFFFRSLLSKKFQGCVWAMGCLARHDDEEWHSHIEEESRSQAAQGQAQRGYFFPAATLGQQKRDRVDN
jgi:hypothetical protein